MAAARYVIEIDGLQKFACGTKPVDGMKIIYQREDLASLRKERLKEYAQRVKNNEATSNSCCETENTADENPSCC